MKSKTNLFFNWYPCPARQHEIDSCLENNRKVFDNVIVIEGRPTFAQLFELTKQFPNDINCFSNSDIYFQDTSLLHNINENECYALCRWDQRSAGIRFFNHADSQDAWIFRGTIKPINAHFTMGFWGCDNRLAYEIKEAGYDIKSPSLSIKIIHLHAVDNRNHQRTKDNTIPGPYLTLIPTK